MRYCTKGAAVEPHGQRKATWTGAAWRASVAAVGKLRQPSNVIMRWMRCARMAATASSVGRPRASMQSSHASPSTLAHTAPAGCLKRDVSLVSAAVPCGGTSAGLSEAASTAGPTTTRTVRTVSRSRAPSKKRTCRQASTLEKSEARKPTTKGAFAPGELDGEGDGPSGRHRPRAWMSSLIHGRRHPAAVVASVLAPMGPSSPSSPAPPVLPVLPRTLCSVASASAATASSGTSKCTRAASSWSTARA
mmetsp:Transcript_12662/g.40452  ORF Transcript_12662/g.40452 Transcript_12662/m.40452 type:complete len:248 (-) Transcript_12662:867-1610(-)